MTSTVDVKDDTRARPIQKAKVNIFRSKKWSNIVPELLANCFFYANNGTVARSK
jgi:hypothetical protein